MNPERKAPVTAALGAVREGQNPNELNSETPMEAESLKLAVERLSARYTPEPVPPCCVCGSPLQIARAGGGAATEYACPKARDGDYSPRGHYSRSHFQHRRPGDEDVLLLLAAWNTRSSSGENGSALAESASEEPDGSFASDSSRKSEEAARTWILLASIWYDGGFVAETLNERRLQSIMERQGYWPITSDLELITLRNEYRSDRSPDPLTPAAGRAGKAEEGE